MSRKSDGPVIPSYQINNQADLYVIFDLVIEAAKEAGFIEDQIGDAFEDNMDVHFPFEELDEDE